MRLSYNNIRIKFWYCLDWLLHGRVTQPPLILSGFWRSGTTWVQQVLTDSLAAKSQFEPLEPNGFIPLHGGPDYDRNQGAYIPITTDVFTEQDWRYLDLAFKGISPARSAFNYMIRKSAKECFSRRVIIKFVRAQFILPDLLKHYCPQGVVHISRHPMAVVQSLSRTKWEWNPSNIKFSDLYWRESSFHKCSLIDELRSYDDASKEEKIAALWALTEREVRRCEDVVFVKYESLLKKPEYEFASLLTKLDLHQTRPVNYFEDSPVTENDRFGATLEERLNSWRHKLSSDKQKSIKNVLFEIWPEVEQEWSF